MRTGWSFLWKDVLFEVSWIGDIPCRLVISNHERSSAPSSDSYSNVSRSFPYNLSEMAYFKK